MCLRSKGKGTSCTSTSSSMQTQCYDDKIKWKRPTLQYFCLEVTYKKSVVGMAGKKEKQKQDNKKQWQKPLKRKPRLRSGWYSPQSHHRGVRCCI